MRTVVLPLLWAITTQYILLRTCVAQPLPNRGETLAIESKMYSIPVPKEYALNGGHLQGVQLRQGMLLVSGSSDRAGYLAVFQKLGDDFRFVAMKKLAERPFDHAGGFQLADQWLAIGLEDPVGKRRSMVQLIDVSSFERLSGAPVYTLVRKGEHKRSTAGAVALLKRKDHFLLAVGSWNSTVIDLYRSNHLDPYADDFQFEPWTSWDSREAKRNNWTDRNYGNYQSLQLSEDSSGVYLTGFARSRKIDIADTYRVHTAKDPYTLLQKVSSYTVQCRDGVSFRNGAGLTEMNGVPHIIAVGHQLFPATNIQLFPIKRK